VAANKGQERKAQSSRAAAAPKHNDLVLALPLVPCDEELAGHELVGVHDVQELLAGRVLGLQVLPAAVNKAAVSKATVNKAAANKAVANKAAVNKGRKRGRAGAINTGALGELAGMRASICFFAYLLK